eukprot:1424633-Pleurochrysis_carterae.AAC.2
MNCAGSVNMGGVSERENVGEMKRDTFAKGCVGREKTREEAGCDCAAWVRLCGLTGGRHAKRQLGRRDLNA